MKLYKILSLGALSLFFLFSFFSCEKSAGELDYGYEKIYIPQSTRTGSDLNYYVPQGLDSVSRNYILDKTKDKVNIILGVSRSGTYDPQSFAVDIINRRDTIPSILAGNTIKNGVLLPESLYTLPTKIEVGTGKTEQTFYLSVDATLLKANYTGKNALMAFEITNPTKYTLNHKNNKVVVIIDVDALKIP